MAQAGFTNRVRVAGSGFTIFTFGGQPVTFCQQASITTPSFVGPGTAEIHPLDEPYAVEIVTAAAAGPGQIVLNLFELFGSGGKYSKAWDKLGAGFGSSLGSPFGSATPENASTQIKFTNEGLFGGANDIVDIAIRQAKASPDQLQIVKYIRPVGAGGAAKPYSEEYHGCVITNVIDGEQVEIGTLDVLKQITVAFRYSTLNGKAPEGFNLRNNAL